MAEPRRASETARVFARAVAGGGVARESPAAPARADGGVRPGRSATSKYTLLLEPELAALFDELALRLRRRTGTRVDKSAIMRAAIMLIADDPALLDQLAAELDIHPAAGGSTPARATAETAPRHRPPGLHDPGDR